MKLLAILFTVLASTAYADVAEHTRLLAQWDTMKPSAERDALADRIDNAEIYRAVFQTPKDDAWLGLKPTGISALPADGVIR